MRMATSKLVSPPTGLISANMTIMGGWVYIRSFTRGFREMKIGSGGVCLWIWLKKGEDLEVKEEDFMGFNVIRGRFWYKVKDVQM